MRHSSLLVTLLLLTWTVATAGCETDRTAEDGADLTTSDTTAMAAAEDQSFSFDGDFEGPLGLQLWSVRNEMQNDVPGTLARVRNMGFEEVELAGTYNLSATRFRQMLDAAGLDATSMHAPYERLRDDLDAVLAEAETLGVDYVGVAWIPHPEGEPFTEAMAREAAADFNTWGAAAKEHGLQFFYHTHGYEFQPASDGTVPFDVMMTETDPANVKYEMDVFWVTHPGADPVALLRKYPDRWELMHVKDMKKGTPLKDYSGHAPAEAEVPVGTGLIDYRAVLQAAQEIGLDQYYIEDETTDPLVNIPKSTQFMESVTFTAG